jgi:hypothetical protein
VLGLDRGSTDSMLAWRAATGFKGVVLSFDSRSLRDDADNVRFREGLKSDITLAVGINERTNTRA